MFTLHNINVFVMITCDTVTSLSISDGHTPEGVLVEALFLILTCQHLQ